MKIIKKNAIIGVVASSSAAEYPASNLLNDSPKKKWVAADSTVSFATLDVYTQGVTGSLGLIGVVAEEVRVLVSDPNGIAWPDMAWPEITWETSVDALSVDYELVPGVSDFQNIWVSFEQFDVPVMIRVELRKTAGTPEVLSMGVIQAGEPVVYNSLVYPISESLVDYSIQKELSNGAHYYKRRDIVRTLNCNLTSKRADALSFVRDIYRVYGSEPLLFNLAPPWGNDFIVYGRIPEPPDATHGTPNYSSVSFKLIEVL